MAPRAYEGRSLIAPTHRSWVSAAVMLIASAPMPTLACDTLKQQIQVGRQWTGSAWSEQSDTGTALVRENGSLPGWVLSAEVRCDQWFLGADTAISNGRRNYDGQTSFGTPVTTTSAISDTWGRLKAGWSLNATVELVMDVSLQHTDRTIASTPQAAGYPESYERTLIRAGARWSIPSPVGTWTLSGAKALTGQQTMRLQLPGKDPTTLQFGSPDQWELSLGWRKALSQNLYMEASYRYIHTILGKSATALVTSNGLPVGAAYQPRSTLIERPIAVSIGWTF